MIKKGEYYICIKDVYMYNDPKDIAYRRWNIYGRERSTAYKTAFQTCNGRGNVDGRERSTVLETAISQVCNSKSKSLIAICYAVGNADLFG